MRFSSRSTMSGLVRPSMSRLPRHVRPVCCDWLAAWRLLLFCVSLRSAALAFLSRLPPGCDPSASRGGLFRDPSSSLVQLLSESVRCHDQAIGVIGLRHGHGAGGPAGLRGATFSAPEPRPMWGDTRASSVCHGDNCGRPRGRECSSNHSSILSFSVARAWLAAVRLRNSP
jgi:hypothetical protein